MACAETFVVDLIRKVTNQLKPAVGGRWQEIDPNKTVADYAPDQPTQRAIKAWVVLIMVREGCTLCPWPSNWAAMKFVDLGPALQDC